MVNQLWKYINTYAKIHGHTHTLRGKEKQVVFFFSHSYTSLKFCFSFIYNIYVKGLPLLFIFLFLIEVTLHHNIWVSGVYFWESTCVSKYIKFIAKSPNLSFKLPLLFSPLFTHFPFALLTSPLPPVITNWSSSPKFYFCFIQIIRLLPYIPHINEVIEYLYFFVWHNSPSIFLSKVTHLVSSGRTPPFPIAL